MNYRTGSILHIDKYIFPDGEIKDTGKFMIVLAEMEACSIMVSITTSQDYIPDKLKVKRCIHEENMRIHAYCFPKNEEICENGFSFKKDTYIYLDGGHVYQYDKNNFTKLYKKEQIELQGILTKDELINLVYCVYNSPNVKRKFKPILEQLLENLH